MGHITGPQQLLLIMLQCCSRCCFCCGLTVSLSPEIESLQKEPNCCRCSALGKASDVSPEISSAQLGLGSKRDTPAGKATPFPWPPQLATAAAPASVSLHLIALCVPVLQLLYIIIISINYIEIYTSSHLSTLYASMGNQTQDQRNSFNNRSINFMYKSEAATSDLLNIGRDKDVFAQGQLKDTSIPYVALLGNTTCKIHTLH